uniref:Ribonuclease P protein component n=1 Tax=Roseihalotalea indica TaxID=2867963 RepID=A0AA49GSC1_9BACT|nr:ribonuclease P protein component [Tunicatimonas sp. TK19036]
MRKTFPKREKLTHKKQIDTLFREGKSRVLYPIRFIYLPVTGQVCHQALFTVPKRNYKKAVDRNRIKRQMREAYRLHKHLIPYNPSNNVHFLLGYIYIGKQKAAYQQIETKIKESLVRLIEV